MIDTSKHFKESYRAAELFLCKKKVLKIWVVVAIVHNNAINFRTMKTLVSHVGVFRDFFCQGLGVDLSRVDMNGINMVTCCQSYYFSKVLQICYFHWIISKRWLTSGTNAILLLRWECDVTISNTVNYALYPLLVAASIAYWYYTIECITLNSSRHCVKLNFA